MVGNGLLGVGLTACASYVAYLNGTLVPLHVLALGLIMLPLTFRQRRPIAVTWTVGPAILADLALGFSTGFFEDFALIVAEYTMISYSRWSRLLAATWVGVWIGVHVGIVLGWHDSGHVNLADLPYNWLIFALPTVAGYSVRTRRAYTAEIQERGRLLAQRAAAEERNRIARELHDVVAHSVSVMVLQATAGARLARRDPVQAAGAFDVIQETGRQALVELRRAVGVLHGNDGAPAELLPQPGLDQLGELLDQVRQAGLQVDLAVQGDRRPLPAGVQLFAYRIVQESLTNVLKHAAAGRAQVDLTYGDSDLTVEVCDDGRGSDGAAPEGGHGLHGMRERVSMLGGELELGPVAGGYRVWARLPSSRGER